MEQHISAVNVLAADITTTNAETLARPVADNERIKTIDIIRGVALCGILLMNIPGFGIHWSIFDSLNRGNHTGPDWATHSVVSILFEGTMRGLFSMLFGAGMVLFTMNKKEVSGGPTVAELYYRRLLFLVGFGLINAYVFLWRGDILFFYGLTGMALYPFRKLSAKWLFAVAFLCMSIGMLKIQLRFNDAREKRVAYVEVVKAEKAHQRLTQKQQQDKAAWLQIQNQRFDPENVKDQVAKMRGDYGTVWQFYQPSIGNIEVYGMYQDMWDFIDMMFFGMALLALGFFSNKLSSSTYFMTMLLGYGVGIPVSMIFFYKFSVASVDVATFYDRYRVTPEVLYDVRRLLLALGHASLIMLVFRSKVVPWLMKSLAAVGQMAFTNYLVQSIICTLFFYGYGLGYYNKLSFHQLYYVVGAVWIFQLITSPIWLKYYRFGPFEWAWRSLTYWKKQPMRIK